MGVMSCYRPGCPNIMCDTYIDEIGYICIECQEEFEKGYYKSGEAITPSLRDFMKSDKGDFILPDMRVGVKEFFKNHTR